MSLSATVQKLRNRENDKRDLNQDRGAFISRWRSDVLAVYERFETALKPFVDDGAAQAYQGSTTVSEDLLGEYEINTLILEIIGRRILLVPVARVTVAGTGRLDLYREDRPSELNRILVVRGETAAAHNPDLWMIQDRRNNVSSFEQRTGLQLSIPQSKKEYRHLTDDAIQDSVDYILNV